MTLQQPFCYDTSHAACDVAADKLAILSCVLELDETEDAVRSLVTELVGN